MEEVKRNKSGGTRNNEKRRERSKVAARCRRGKESEIFSELASCLPLPEHLRNTLDKASVARLAVTYLKLNGMLSGVLGARPGEVVEGREGPLHVDPFLNQAIGGFVFVLSADGDLVYVSEGVTKCLGLSQCEVMGQSMFDFTHPCDHVDIRDLVALNRSALKAQPLPRAAFFRMKCTITSRGRNVHLRAATYKGISCNGRLYCHEADPNARWYVGLGEPLSDPTDVNFPLNKQAFVTKHSMDMRCEDVAGNIGAFLGYEAEDLVGRSFYDFHHASDGKILAKNLKALYMKGQIETERYRFLAKQGGWMWCITQATVLKPENGSKPNGILCLHFITSGIENADEILSDLQMQASVEGAASDLPDILAGAGLSNPIPSTAKIFARRTEGMDSGFLMPCGDNTLIVSKEEPEDLTHLAPMAGDECVSLKVPLLDDLLRCFDQANFEYTMSGFFVNVDSDELPLFSMDEHPSDAQGAPLPETSVLLNEKEASRRSSALFLNSDPQMGPLCRDSNFPLFEMHGSCQSPKVPAETPTDGLRLLGGELEAIESLGRLESDFGLELVSEDSTGKESPLPDELSEFRAPFIPTDDGEDIEFLYPRSIFIWPDEPPICGEAPNGSAVGNVGTKTSPPEPPGNQKRRHKHGKVSEQHIDQITWTLDIGSILAARKADDQPKVVTRSVFGPPEPPPMKVRKLGLLSTACRERQGSESVAATSHARLKAASGDLEEMGRKQKSLEVLCGKRRGLEDFTLFDQFILKRSLCGSRSHCAESRLPTFYELTPQDYEVMVPLVDTSLLEGSDLFQALDSVAVNPGHLIPNM